MIVSQKKLFWWCAQNKNYGLSQSYGNEISGLLVQLRSTYTYVYIAHILTLSCQREEENIKRKTIKTPAEQYVPRSKYQNSVVLFKQVIFKLYRQLGNCKLVMIWFEELLTHKTTTQQWKSLITIWQFHVAVRYCRRYCGLDCFA